MPRDRTVRKCGLVKACPSCPEAKQKTLALPKDLVHARLRMLLG